MSARVERVVVQCAACGRDNEKRVTDVARNKSGRFFCDTDCLNEVGRKPRRRAMRTCEQCVQDFYPTYDPKARFCKKDCYDEWQRRNRVTKTCEVCGRDFVLKPSQAAHLTGRFCDKHCESESRIKRPLDRMHNGRPAVLDSNGYVRIWEPGNPSVMQGDWMFEHRFVAEQTLGRRLVKDEHVHHANGDKADNRPENLIVMGHGEHSSVTGLVNGERLREWEEYRRRYGPLT